MLKYIFASEMRFTISKKSLAIFSENKDLDGILLRFFVTTSEQASNAADYIVSDASR